MYAEALLKIDKTVSAEPVLVIGRCSSNRHRVDIDDPHGTAVAVCVAPVMQAPQPVHWSKHQP